MEPSKGSTPPATRFVGQSPPNLTRWHPAADGRSGSLRPAEDTPGRPRAELPSPCKLGSAKCLEPLHRTAEMHDRQVVARGLFIAGGDATEGLERVEEHLDQIALAVQLLVVATDFSPRRVRRDDVLHAARLDGVANVAGVVAGVGDTSLATGVRDERGRYGRLVLLPRRQLHVQRSAPEIYDRVELGRKASTRASQSIASEPPFPPAAS